MLAGARDEERRLAEAGTDYARVVLWLEQHGFACSDANVDRVFGKAKSTWTVLSEEEIVAEVYR